MIERGLSARTIRYPHAVLRSAMRQALQWRLLLENPVDGVKTPLQLRGDMRSLTVEQAQTFLRAALGTPHGLVLAVALTTGIRPSEHLGLKWQDIDWARQTVSVLRSVRRLEGRWCFCDTKRSRSRRPVKLQGWIVALLRDLQRKASEHDLAPDAHDLVFRTPAGQPMNADYLAKHFRSMLGPSRFATNQALRFAPLGGPQLRWQPECHQKLCLSSSDMPAPHSRWILTLMFCHTCRTRVPQE